ncbi:Glyoxysomal fatty acid beta-oxidation multifunctional protein MFP-a [Hordeum vulgare]|nr:Glyoxysomal fatty acid beta-oxidation multifunctional protein MFP-a [Hordeum vulgare]
MGLGFKIDRDYKFGVSISGIQSLEFDLGFVYNFKVGVEYVPEKPHLGTDNPLLLGAFASVEKFSLTDHTAAARVEVPGITDLGLMPRKVSKVAIVGGGLMGSGTATALILSHYHVILKEVDEKFLNAGMDRIKALLLVDHGMDVYKIDQVCTEFGMPIGPFRMTYLVGFGVALATGMQYLENFPEHLENFPERVYKSMLIPLMIEDKRTGKLFIYNLQRFLGSHWYEGKRKASPDLEIMNYVEESRRIAGATPDPELLKLDNSTIAEMVLFRVINEACCVLGEGITFKASDLDIASIFGMGFPPYKCCL